PRAAIYIAAAARCEGILISAISIALLVGPEPGPAVRYSKEGKAKVVEDAFILASALEKQMRAMFGESAEDIIEGIWREIYWLDKVLPDYVFEILREKIWELHTIEESARIVDEHLPQYREYIERLRRIADLLKAAAEKLVEEAEKEGKGSIRWMNGRPHIAYEGSVELSVQVEHVTRDGRKYAVIEVKYGERTARVELEVEELRRSALLHNLAAIATDDVRKFYEGRVSHNTASPVQAAERLAMWALFMPGEYKITVRYVYATEEGLSPDIEISSRFGWGGIEKVENSPIHRLVLKLARELAGVENLKEAENATNYILAASWLIISAILNAPGGGRPSEGLAALAEKGVLPRAALNRLRPIFEELDRALGSISRADKAYLVGKIVDYDGSVDKGLLLVSAEKIKEMPVELSGVKIRMADVALAAAKALSEEGRWSGNQLSLGPAREVLELKVDEEVSLKIPAFKAMAALMAQEMREEVDELRRKELVEYVELASYKVDGLEIKIFAAKAKEELTPIRQENLKEIWREFKIGKYTHLRLIVRYKEYELLYRGGMFEIRGEGARKLAKALEGLGLDVKLTSDGRLYLGYERLEKLLSAGVKAYAVRKAKMGEAMWHVEITYEGVTMALEMSYDERNIRLKKRSETGKIEVIVYEESAAKGERAELDLDLLADIKEGRADCGDCLEKWLAEAFAVASEWGFRWSVISDRKYLYVYLPSDFKDVVRRFYSE
ncbi:MAG: hypothetical protein JZD41_02065, partial [Thermoproteus sp.]|nr:hypothetical protein [Thermoproteus sp.]